MDKELYSLSKIFTEKLYRIPDYQRGYAWNLKQLKDFWNDLEQLEDRKNHYVGVLTLEEVSSEVINQWQNDSWIIQSKGYDAYYIVDGQQRLTTSIILIQGLIECTEKNTKLNYNTVEEIRKKYIFDSKDDDGGISRSYIFGYEKDNPSYEFLKTKVFDEHSFNISDNQETIYTHNLEIAKRFFRDALEKLSHAERENIFKKLTQHLLFNLFTISNDIDVCIAFETMNNRGKPLSVLELLKNRLIYLTIKLNVEDYEKRDLRHSINEAWKTVYHNLGKNKDNPLDDDKFLFNHFILYFGEDTSTEDEISAVETFGVNINTSRYVIRADYYKFLLEKIFISKNIVQENNGEGSNKTIKLNTKFINDYVRDLQQSVVLWHKISNPYFSDFSENEKIWLDKLNRLVNIGTTSVVFPLIMVFFKKETNTEKRVRFLKALELLIFFGLLIGFPSQAIFAIAGFNTLEKAINLSKSRVTAEKLIKELEEIFNETCYEKGALKRIKSELKTRGFYKWRGIKYFLYEYDLHLQSLSKHSQIKINWYEFINNDFTEDYRTVEHIYPQTDKDKYWHDAFQKYTVKEKNILKNSLGNLLPLSSAKNSSFSNKSFLAKKGNEINTIGYRYGSFSENEVATYENWTAKEILKRGIDLLNFMEERWKFSIGNEQEKIEFLGIGFVLKKEGLSN